MADLGQYQVPHISNEPNQHYGVGSIDREKLAASLASLEAALPLTVPVVIGGIEFETGDFGEQICPGQHQKVLARYYNATPELIDQAIRRSLMAKQAWETSSLAERSAVFLKAANLIAGKYRYDLMAATMLGQGKNAWQAEIDAATELVDFFRFNCKYAQELYAQQPPENAPGIWNRVEYRALEGFVYAVTPFNFTAIGGNLPGAPALMGNAVLWKPSPMAVYSNYMVHKILLEAGLPGDIIQFLPADAIKMTDIVLQNKSFASLHFTGSTAVFKSLYTHIGTNLDTFKSYPRIVGETGGKNFHMVHESANIRNAVVNTVRGAFEYQGQKCSACSRIYIPDSIADEFITQLKLEISSLKVGRPQDFQNFIGPVINQGAFDRLKQVIDGASSSGLKLLAGGKYDDSQGYYIYPTLYQTTDIDHPIMSRELFGPILVLYVYNASEFETVLNHIDTSSHYALTGSIFAQDRAACKIAMTTLRNSAGNFYINDKCTGAVVGQQPFGGGRASGTNDKAGSINLLYRFVSVRSVKENFTDSESVLYPSNMG